MKAKHRKAEQFVSQTYRIDPHHDQVQRQDGRNFGVVCLLQNSLNDRNVLLALDLRAVVHLFHGNVDVSHTQATGIKKNL